MGLKEKIASSLYNQAKKIPAIRKRVDQEFAAMLEGMAHSVKPYQSELQSYPRLPATARGRDEILEEMEELHRREQSKWQDGFVSGAVYHGDAEHIDFLNRVYALSSQSNPLHADIWPSGVKYEAEIVSMTAGMLGADNAGPSEPNEICGTVSSGGTESILLAMKTYRDWAKASQGITQPNLVVPTTVHAAFDKAAQYFNIELRRIPVGADFRANVAETQKAVDGNTIVLVGSAPGFPHGLIDPIEELSELARAKGCGFHTDACLGGFVLPWAKKLGYDVPPFDFSLPGVTSMSADTHKYGFAAKGTSVVLYRGRELRRFQYYKTADWPGGLYLTPTFAGSRPGALSATCWAALLSMGEDGYMKATQSILEAAASFREGFEEIPELNVIGDPLWVIAFASDDLNIYRVLDEMTKKGWSLNGLHKPQSVHICVTLRHTPEGVVERFVDDLGVSVATTKETPSEKGGMAPVYGMAATIPARTAVTDFLENYVDFLYDV